MFSDTFRNTFSAYVTRHEENDSSRDQEHMFNKVVTPSDVGKLNRLVIPKQCAEKYFPLDSSINEKGKILNFEDKYGKSWRFRYSYWNSSQSYVMTKGWSRFVKEKRLEAGDTVTFSRGLNKDRFYIDYKRRSNALNRTTLGNLVHPLTLSRLVLPSPVIPTISINSFLHPFYSGNYGVVHHGSPMLLENRPVTHQKVAPKRIRLFGVNLDCPDDDENNRNGGGYVDYSSPHSFVSGISHGGNLPRKEKEFVSVELNM